MLQRKRTALAAVCAAALCLQGCAGTAETAEPVPKPTGVRMKAEVQWPSQKLETGENGVPRLRVYVVEKEAVETVDLETFRSNLGTCVMVAVRCLRIPYAVSCIRIVSADDYLTAFSNRLLKED